MIIISLRKIIDPSEIERQRKICAEIKEKMACDKARLAMVDTYGCQQNEADSEILRGYLSEMGYGFTEDEFMADVVAVNTCAVREHAEMRVLGNVGALTHTKRKNKNQIIILCGCMVQQEHMVEKIRHSYRHVDLVFGPHELWRFPELFERAITEKNRIFEIGNSAGAVAEGLPVRRDGRVKAWLSIMYGCDNFCSYCVVPKVRGRERSRLPGNILEDAETLIGQGFKDITLLGQNVNSYGKGLDDGTSFPKLLHRLGELEGRFILRFMTSHPKDAGEELFLAMSQTKKCARHLHLPAQSGSDGILRAMNRGYGSEDYLRLVRRARELMPDLVLTSDIIVGFPGETEDDFEKTMELVNLARFDALFTFIYSKRRGTPAASMPETAGRDEIGRRFDRLLELQNRISEEKHAAYVGKTIEVLVDGRTSGEYNLTSRTNGGRLVHLKGDPGLVGSFISAKITESRTWALFGSVAGKA